MLSVSLVFRTLEKLSENISTYVNIHLRLHKLLVKFSFLDRYEIYIYIAEHAFCFKYILRYMYVFIFLCYSKVIDQLLPFYSALLLRVSNFYLYFVFFLYFKNNQSRKTSTIGNAYLMVFFERLLEFLVRVIAVHTLES